MASSTTNLDGLHVIRGEAALLLGVSLPAVDKLTADGRVSKTADGRVSVAGICNHLRGKAARRHSPEAETQLAEWRRWRAKSARLSYRRERRSLVDVKLVNAELTAAYIELRHTFEDLISTLPTAVAGRDERECFVTIDAGIRAALESFVEHMDRWRQSQSAGEAPAKQERAKPICNVADAVPASAPAVVV